MINWSKRNRIKLICTILILLSQLSGAQDHDKIVKSAIFIAHTDFSEFSIPDTNEFDYILKQYQIRNLQNSGITKNNCSFFEITPLNCTNCKNCKMLIVYWHDERRFFRLNGFRYNEFIHFYNVIIMEENSSLKIKKNRNSNRNRNLLFKNVNLEGYRLDEMYQKYFDNNGKLFLDTTSCFYQSLIIEH